MELDNKSLLIVKSTGQALTAAESFLRNRGWKLFATANLKEALTYMIQTQPAFVMVSVDHPNKKVRNLIKVLPQAFPCCVIVFAEHANSASLKMLTDTRAEYLIFPPATGPAVERTVNKYYKDQAKKAAMGLVTERGEFSADGEKLISIKGSGISAQTLLAQIMNDEAGAHVGHYNPQLDPTQTRPQHFNPQGEVHGEEPQHFNPQVQARQRYQPLDPGYNGRARLMTGTPENWGRLLQKNSGGGAVPRSSQAGTEQDSLILRGTREALEKSVVKTARSEDDVARIEESSNVACIVIESSRFSGYLVAALGKNRRIDQDFIKAIRERLFRFLSEHGEKIKSGEDEAMQIKIKQVPFEDWALQYAEFLRKSVHQGDEVAMAFFPHSDVAARTKDSASEQMMAVALTEIKADVAVEFNLYLYLPTNQKYVLYTPRGGKIYQNQLDKLSQQGVSEVHLFKNDMPDLNKYRAQNYLNSKIEEYETLRGDLKDAAS